MFLEVFKFIPGCFLKKKGKRKPTNIRCDE